MRTRLFVLVVVLLSLAEIAFAQGYGGPSVLSRGGNRPGRRGRSAADIAFYAGVRGTYDARLTPVQLDEAGGLTTFSRSGLMADIGAYGAHSWSKTSLGVDYRGDYRRQLSNSSNRAFSGFNGTNQALSLQLQHQLTKRVSLSLNETAGTSNRAFGGFAAPAGADVNNLNLVNNEVFDTRTYYNQTSLTGTYLHSARTSFFAGSGVFYVKRPNRQLVGTWGSTVASGVQYRVSRRTSVGAQYMYMRFNFPRVSGGTEAHATGVFASRSLSRNTDLSLGVGVIRARTYGTQQVQLSPEVAAVLGRPTSVAAYNTSRWSPQFNASFGYTLERSRYYASTTTGITPGNGVYLTSRVTTVSTGYSYSGIRRLSLGASANYSRYSREGISVGTFSYVGAGGGLNYKLAGHLSLSSQADYRTFTSPTINGRKGYGVSLGLTLSSVPLPVSIW